MLKASPKTKTVRKPLKKAAPAPLAPVPTNNDIALAAQEITDKAAAEIRGIRTRVAVLQSAIFAEQEEIQTLQKAIQEHHRYIAYLLNTRDVQARKHTESVNYFSVAQGTTGERAARLVLEAEKSLLDRMQEDLDREEPLAEKGSIQDQALIDVLLPQLNADLQELDQCQLRVQIVENVRVQSLGTLEEAQFALFQEEHASHTHKIEAARVALDQARDDEKQFLDVSHERFKSFPSRQRSIKLLMPEDSPTLRVLSSQLQYMDSLLDDGRFMESGLHLSAVGDYYNWRQVLCLSSDEIYVNETLEGNPRELRSHRDRVERLKAEYIARIYRR